eukprot:COSAG01_NODE_5595_length_4158_cov_12.029598_2_plen_94_part_00
MSIGVLRAPWPLGILVPSLCCQPSVHWSPTVPARSAALVLGRGRSRRGLDDRTTQRAWELLSLAAEAAAAELGLPSAAPERCAIRNGQAACLV